MRRIMLRVVLWRRLAKIGLPPFCIPLLPLVLSDAELWIRTTALIAAGAILFIWILVVLDVV